LVSGWKAREGLCRPARTLLFEDSEPALACWAKVFAPLRDSRLGCVLRGSGWTKAPAYNAGAALTSLRPLRDSRRGCAKAPPYNACD
jgi:hypothetical protein